MKLSHPQDLVISSRKINFPSTEMILNSLAQGSCGSNFKRVISKHMFMSVCETTLRWITQTTFADTSTLIQVTAWLGVIREQSIASTNVDPDLCCHIYGIIRAQWVIMNHSIRDCWQIIFVKWWIMNMFKAYLSFASNNQRVKVLLIWKFWHVGWEKRNV